MPLFNPPVAGEGGEHPDLATHNTLGLATEDELTAHAADTTSVHGIADTSALATTSTVTTAVSNHSADTTDVHGIADTSDLILEGDSRLTDARTPTAHNHNASDVNAGTLDIARVPTGTTGTTVALGDHTHNGLAPTGGTTGQVLKKASNTNYDYAWDTDATGAGGGALPDLSDVDDAAAPSNGHFLVGDGTDWSNRAIQDADIPSTIARDSELHTRQHSVTSASDHTFPGGTTSFLRADGSFAAPVVEAFPVGSIFVSVVSTNPGTLLGYGTWSAFGAGRTLVGIDAGQTEFDTVKETGGAKTHTLTTTEIPAHSHVQGVNSATTGGLSGYAPDTSTNTRANSGYSTSDTGGGAAHNNLQPYIVVYFWERTA